MPAKKNLGAITKPRYLIKITDDLGSMLSFESSPRKIVSLVPSITETLVHIGLENSLIGITKFCIHPKHLRNDKVVTGGTKNPRIAEIIHLKPDLVFANKEENRPEDIIHLKLHMQVFVTDIATIEDVVSFLNKLQLIFTTAVCAPLIQTLSNLPVASNRESITCCYLIWKNPWMTVGNDTFIHHMMEIFGFKNVFDEKNRYPVTTLKDIQILQPEVIMLSSEPYPFNKSEDRKSVV